MTKAIPEVERVLLSIAIKYIDIAEKSVSEVNLKRILIYLRNIFKS